MRRWKWIGLAVLVAGGVLVGCPAFHDDYPTTACKTDSDCYLNEICTNQVCAAVVPPDMTIPPMFHFDFAMPTDMMSCNTDLGCPDLAGGGDM